MSVLSVERARKLIDSATVEISSPQLCQLPTVSILVNVFNHQKYIRQTIQSILDQRFDEPYEIIIGDDCSTDGTGEILADYLTQFPDRIRLLNGKRNLGQHTGNGRLNLMRMLEASRGEFLALLPGDDAWLGREKLSAGVETLRCDTGANMVFHNILIESPGADNMHFYTSGDWQSPQLPLPKMVTTRADMIRGLYVHASSVIARRRTCSQEQLQFFLDRNFGDWFLMLVLAGEGRIVFRNTFDSLYRFHGKGVYSQLGAAAKHKLYQEDRKAISQYFENLYPAEVADNLAGRVVRTWAASHAAAHPVL